jgi:photosystem II stability/assembly factor-like uncharacterized protein
MYSAGTNIYAGTGKGIYLSSDEGISWVQRFAGIEALPPYAYCFTSGNSIVFSGVSNGGLYSTTDDGIDWNHSGNGIYANSIFYCLTTFNNVLMAGGNYGVYLSTDNGASWFRATTNPPLIIDFLPHGSEIYACGYGGIFRSTDNGHNWLRAYNGAITFISMAAGVSDLFAASQFGLYKSTNNGQNWSSFPSPASPNPIMSIATYSDKLFVCYKDSGLYVSTNSGTSWSTGLSGFYSRHPMVIIQRGSDLYCGTNYRTGIYKSTDAGTSWRSMNNGFNNCGINALAVSGNTIFAATNFEGVHLSTDYGNSWVLIAPQLPVGPFATVSAHDNYVLAGNKDSLFLSTDMGTHFTGVVNDSVSGSAISGSYFFEGGSGGINRSTDYGATWANVSTIPAKSFAISGSNILAGGKNVILSSPDNGASWTTLKSGPFGWVIAIVILDSGIFAATNGSINGDGILKSTDLGITWNQANTGISSGYMNTLVNYGDTLFTVSNDIYYSTDYGRSWYSCGANLTGRAPEQLAVLQPYMFSGTFDLSVWKRPLSELIGISDKRQKIPAEFSLMQNYPNPFNPVTIISYDIRKTADVKLVVYDILGKEVKVLVEQKQSAGTYNVRFDGTNLSSGVYFYKLTATAVAGSSTGDFSATKKMVLVK